MIEKKPREITVQYHFIEQKKYHFDYLEDQLRHSPYCEYLGSTIYLHNQAFQDMVNLLVKAISKYDKTGKAIFILDQYGYKDVPFNRINHIMNTLQHAEIILTFAFDSLKNFISDHKANRKSLENINLDQHVDFNRIEELREAGLLEAVVQEQLSNAIYKASGAKHITLFFIKPKRGLTYWLVHLSNVYKARDVMMQLHWQYANQSVRSEVFEHHLSPGIFQLGYQATQTPLQTQLDFGHHDFGKELQEKCTNSLAVEIPKYFCDKEITLAYSELISLMGSLTPASENELKEALQRAMATRELAIIPSGDTKQRRSAKQIKHDDKIQYCQTQIIFS